MTKASQKVDRLMAYKATERDLWKDKIPSLYRHLIHELAEVIHFSESDRCAVSWSAQQRAMKYFNENGFEQTLNHMLELRGNQIV